MHRMRIVTICLLSLAWWISGGCAASAQRPATQATTRAAKPHNFARWEKQIADFEQQDKTNPPPKHAVLFVGASSIRRWTTVQQDFPNYQVINRGFGGSEIEDSTHFADRIIFPYKPKMIFLRAGGNDLHGGKTVERTYQDFKDFVTKVRSRLPDATIVFISQCPTPARWNERDENKALDVLIKQYAQRTPGVKYVETYDLVLTPEGKVREELFVNDRQHFNADGNKLMAERVRALLP